MDNVYMLIKVETSTARAENGFNLENMSAKPFMTKESAFKAMQKDFRETVYGVVLGGSSCDGDEAYVCSDEGDETFWRIKKASIIK